MTLRDQEGEIEVGIGDLFPVRSRAGHATLSVCCKDRAASRHGAPVVTCRVYEGLVETSGVVLRKGEMLNCRGEFVARKLRDAQKLAQLRPMPVLPIDAPSLEEPESLF